MARQWPLGWYSPARRSFVYVWQGAVGLLQCVVSVCDLTFAAPSLCSFVAIFLPPDVAPVRGL